MKHTRKLLSLLLVLALVLSFAPMALAAEGDQDPAEALAEQLGGDVDAVQNPDGSFTVTGENAEAEPAEDAEPAEAEEEAEAEAPVEEPAEAEDEAEPVELELDEAPLLEAASASSTSYVAKLTLGGDDSYYYSIADAVAAWLATENTDATITLAGTAALAAAANVRGTTADYIDGFMMLAVNTDELPMTDPGYYIPTSTDHVLAVKETAKMEIPVGRGLTLDLNGQNFYNTVNPLFTVLGDLTVEGAGANGQNGSGTSDIYLFMAYGAANVTINDWRVYASGRLGCVYGNGTIAVNNCVYRSPGVGAFLFTYEGGAIALTDTWAYLMTMSLYGAFDDERVTSSDDVATLTVNGGYIVSEMSNSRFVQTGTNAPAESVVSLSGCYIGTNVLTSDVFPDLTLTVGNAVTFRAAGTNGEDDTGTIVNPTNAEVVFAGGAALSIPVLRVRNGSSSVTNKNTSGVTVGRVEVSTGGVLNASELTGVTIDDFDPETVDGIYLTANGATLTGSTSIPVIVDADMGSGDVTLADGTKASVTVKKTSGANITSGTVTSLTVEQGTVNVAGGTVGALTMTNGTVNVTDGSVTTMTVNGGTVTVSGRGSVGTMNISGGTLMGDVSEWNVTTLRITGGYFPDMKDSELTALGSLGIIDLENYTVSGGYVYLTSAGAPYVARLNNKTSGTGYMSLQAALSAAEAGNTVYLVSDTTENAVVPKLPSGGITLDFNGHTLTNSSVSVRSGAGTLWGGTIDWLDPNDTYYNTVDALSVHGTVTLVDSVGTAEGTYNITGENCGLTVYPGGDATIGLVGGTQGVKINCKRFNCFVNGSLTIHDAVIEGEGMPFYVCGEWRGCDPDVLAPMVEAGTFSAPSLTINGGTFDHSHATTTQSLLRVRYGSVTINGGTFTHHSTVGAAVLLADGVSADTEIEYTPSATITVNGGTFTKENATGFGALSRYAGSNIVINAGTFWGYCRANNGGMMTIGATEGDNANDSAVTVYSNGSTYALGVLADSVLTINHGTFYGDRERTYAGNGVTVTARTGYVLYRSGTGDFTINGGRFLSGYDAEDYPDVYVINGNRNDTWTGGYFDRLLLTAAYTTTFNGSSAGIVDLNGASSGLTLTSGTVTTLNLTLGTATLNGGTVTTANVTGGTLNLTGLTTGSIGTLNVTGGVVNGDVKALVTAGNITAANITVTGGSFPGTSDAWLNANAVADGYVAQDHIVMRAGSSDPFEGAVAKTVSGGATTYYDSLQAAVYAATADGATVTLLAETTENVLVPKVENVAITIDFNGHTLTTSAEGKSMSIYAPNQRVASAFAVYGDATIVNTGENGKSYNIENSAGGYAILVFPGGKLTVGGTGGTDGVDIRSTSTCAFGVMGGELVVHAAEVLSSGNTHGNVIAVQGSTSLFAGTEESNTWTTYAAASRVTVNGGTFTNNHGSARTIELAYGEAVINGGDFSAPWANARMLGNYNASVMTINGGTFLAIGNIVYADNTSTVTVTGGTFYGNLAVANAGATLILGDPADPAKGPTVYEFNGANAQTYGVVHLARAGVVTVYGGTYHGGLYDEAGRSVTYLGPALSNEGGGTLTVHGGTFYGGGEISAVADEAKSVTLSGGTFDNISTSAARTLTIDGATVTGTLAVSGGTTLALTSGSVGTLEVSGGTVTTNLDGMSATVGEYQVTGGVFSATAPDYMNNTPGVLAAGYVATALGEGSTVGAANAASVSIGGGAETYYSSLQAAIDAAGATAATVRLYADVTENVVVAAGQTITLDFNGHTLTNSGTGKNSSTYVTGTVFKDALSVYGTATLVNSDAEGNEYNLVNTVSGGCAVAIYPDASVTVGAATGDTPVSYSGGAGTFGYAVMGGTLVLNSASAYSTSSNNGKIVVLSGGDNLGTNRVGGTYSTYRANSAVTVNGGDYVGTGGGHMFQPYYGSITFYGGTLTSTGAGYTVSFAGSTAARGYFYGGTFNGTIWLNGNNPAVFGVEATGAGPTVYASSGASCAVYVAQNKAHRFYGGSYYGGVWADGVCTTPGNALQINTNAPTANFVLGGSFYSGGETKSAIYNTKSGLAALSPAYMDYTATSLVGTQNTNFSGTTIGTLIMDSTRNMTLTDCTVNNLVQTGQTLTLSGTVNVKDGTVSGGTITGGTMNVTGGLEIAEGASIASAVSFASGSTATVSGGTITGAITFASGSNASITGGEFTGATLTLDAGSGGVISGGTFSNALSVGSGSVTRIIGGTFTGTLPASFTGTGFISGGTFDNEPIAALIEPGYQATGSGPYTIASLGVARIGNKYAEDARELLSEYLTIPKSAGKTVSLLQDTTVPANSTAGLNASGYLDLNGQTLTVESGASLVAFGEIFDSKGGGSIRVADGATVYLPDSLKYTRSTQEAYKSETAQRSNKSAVALKGSVTVEDVTYTEYKVYDFSMRTHEPKADLDDERGGVTFGFRPDFAMSAAYTQLSGGWSAAGIKVGMILSSDGLMSDTYYYFSDDTLNSFASNAVSNTSRVMMLELSNLKSLKGNPLTVTPFLEVNSKIVRFQPMSYTYELPTA